MNLIGLTGGIASGKSTVSKMFADAGFPIIDADEISRDLLGLGEFTQSKVAARFPEAVKPSGEIDRKALAAIVFADPERLKILEGIIHPQVAAIVQGRAAKLEMEGHKVAIYDAPLLIEAGQHRGLHAVILVHVPVETQVVRALARGGITEAEVRQRIAAQMPIADKWQHATNIIDNGGPLEETRKQVRLLIAFLKDA